MTTESIAIQYSKDKRLAELNFKLQKEMQKNLLSLNLERTTNTKESKDH